MLVQLLLLALPYTDMKRMGVWTKRILDVKHMCLAWMKKDSERAKTILAKRERDNCEMLVVLVREILAAEVSRPRPLEFTFQALVALLVFGERSHQLVAVIGKGYHQGRVCGQ